VGSAECPEELGERRVLGLVHFEDPHSKLRMELAYGAEMQFIPHFHPSRAISGFVTGHGGMGHVVTYVGDVHCNPRHHSLAFFGNPQPQRMANHVMLEYTSLDDVGTAYDICRARDAVKVELGRHANDRMVSFYATNPSGWFIELGWGAREIDPASFAVERFTMSGGSGMGEWGHGNLMELI
jgi:hypothetical protein